MTCLQTSACVAPCLSCSTATRPSPTYLLHTHNIPSTHKAYLVPANMHTLFPPKPSCSSPLPICRHLQLFSFWDRRPFYPHTHHPSLHTILLILSLSHPLLPVCNFACIHCLPPLLPLPVLLLGLPHVATACDTTPSACLLLPLLPHCHAFAFAGT